MKKEEAIERFLSEHPINYVPVKTSKSELFLLTNEEFDKLRKHLEISDYQISENGYDTITIQNYIFKKQFDL
jgi:hypothetical protein